MSLIIPKKFSNYQLIATVLSGRKNVTRIRSRSIRTFASPSCAISKAELNQPEESIKVNFSNGEAHSFPWVFLQDNCTCPECFHPSSRSRLRKLTELNLENAITRISATSDQVVCTFADGHKSAFDENWLLSRRFSGDNISSRRTGFRDDPKLVGSDHVIERETFDNVMQNDASLLKVLKTLCETGVFIIEGAPTEVGQVRRIAERIGFIRLTHYGNEFTVKSEKDAVNLAYTSTKLGLHTDLPYYVYPPGTQMLHCIKQYEVEEEGGRSVLVDGFQVAEQMRMNHPTEFKVLCEVPLEFHDIGKDHTEFHKVHHSPSFALDPNTYKVTRIVYSNQQLSSYLPITLENVRPLYKALKLFTDICYESENLIQFKLKQGEIVFFDNWRFLHGREGFDSSLGDRHLEGCYVDWDEVFCRIRVLDSKM